MTTPAPSDAARDRRIIRFTVAALFGMLALNVAMSFFWKGWGSAGFNTLVVSLAFLVFAAREGSRLVWHWLLLTTVAGLVELAADWWLVVRTGSLVYSDGPRLVESPIYMPFAWMLVLIQIGLIGRWLRGKVGFGLASLLTAALAGVNIPVYESLAKNADWWIYQDTPMIWNAPWYIILGELLIGLPLVWKGLQLEKNLRPATAVGLGVALGLIIWLAYGLTWWLVGPCEGAALPVSCS